MRVDVGQAGWVLWMLLWGSLLSCAQSHPVSDTESSRAKNESTTSDEEEFSIERPENDDRAARLLDTTDDIRGVPATWPIPSCAVSPHRQCPTNKMRGANFSRGSLSGEIIIFNANASRSLFNGADLSNADLSYAILHDTSFQMVDLERADLIGADLTGADMFGADLTNTSLLGANLTLADLSRIIAPHAELNGANLTLADLTGADLARADLRGVTWHHTICPDGTNSDDNGNTCGGHFAPPLEGCAIAPLTSCPDADLSEAPLAYANLKGANLERANLRQANLTRANLRGTILAYTQLIGANLTGADLKGANLGRADLTDTIWQNTRCPDGTNSDDNGNTCGGHNEPRITACQIRPRARCAGADLGATDLSYANLRRSDLRGADLSGSDLTGADLRGANLARANLTGATLDTTNLKGARLRGTTMVDTQWKNAVCPNGRKSGAQGGRCP